MKRRKFILSIGLAGVAAILLTTFVTVFNNYRKLRGKKLLQEPNLLLSICNNEAVIALGKIYRKKHIETFSELKLLKLISNDISFEQESITEEMLQRKIIDDYKNGETVMVSGWILSKTEAYQCALFSLAKEK